MTEKSNGIEMGSGPTRCHEKRSLPDLSVFRGGSDVLFDHARVPDVSYMRGVKHLAEAVDCGWLIDRIAANQRWFHIAIQVDQLWILDVRAGTAELRMEDNDGHGNVFHRETIEQSEFPEPGIELLAVYRDRRCIMLPSEY